MSKWSELDMPTTAKPDHCVKCGRQLSPLSVRYYLCSFIAQSGEQSGPFCSQHCRGDVPAALASNAGDQAFLAEIVDGEIGWQPIETAPKDGTWVLACREGSKIPMVSAYDDDDDEKYGARWFTFNLALETAMKKTEPDYIWKPTHWQPLLEPPIKEQP